MWSYYGSKTSLVHLYPPPQHDKIIEPFAGAGKYSLHYFDRDVTLIDSYSVIVKIWLWLQLCSPADILSLPRIGAGQTVNDFTFDCDEAKWFMGFIIGCGAERPRIKATDRKTLQRPNHVNFNLKKIARNLWKIKHWNIIQGDFSAAPKIKATWFIDPPYQYGGQSYVMSSAKLDFQKLAAWSMARKGQVIVCENTKAAWLPFKPLKTQRGSLHSTTEAIWCNDPDQYSPAQLALFTGRTIV